MEETEYFYLYQSRAIRDYDEANNLAATIKGSWVTWNHDRPCVEGWVWALRPAGPVTGPDAVSTPQGLRRTHGGGYGIPVYDSSCTKVGYAYVTYPKCPGIASYVGKRMWIGSPGESDSIVGPTPIAKLCDTDSITQFREMVSRVTGPDGDRFVVC